MLGSKPPTRLPTNSTDCAIVPSSSTELSAINTTTTTLPSTNSPSLLPTPATTGTGGEGAVSYYPLPPSALQAIVSAPPSTSVSMPSSNIGRPPRPSPGSSLAGSVNDDLSVLLQQQQHHHHQQHHYGNTVGSGNTYPPQTAAAPLYTIPSAPVPSSSVPYSSTCSSATNITTAPSLPPSVLTSGGVVMMAAPTAAHLRRRGDGGGGGGSSGGSSSSNGALGGGQQQQGGAPLGQQQAGGGTTNSPPYYHSEGIGGTTESIYPHPYHEPSPPGASTVLIGAPSVSAWHLHHSHHQAQHHGPPHGGGGGGGYAFIGPGGGGGGGGGGGFSLTTVVWQRLSVLISLLLLQSGSQFILEEYEGLISTNVVIPLFLTMLVGAGGNAGNQAAVRSITGLVTGEFEASSMWRVLRQEASVACICAASLFVIGSLRVYFYYVNEEYVPSPMFSTVFAISSALFVIVLSSVVLGAALPFILVRFGFSAEHAAPLIQVVMDILGVFICCVICSLFLPSVAPATPIPSMKVPIPR